MASDVEGWPAVASLWVDASAHRVECARFDEHVIAGPDRHDCAVWVGAIGGDGYGRFYVVRAGVQLCVRPNRYALARASDEPLPDAVLALHECDTPLCVKVCAHTDVVQHVVGGSQRDNMVRMARMRRGGGRLGVPGGGLVARRDRSVALRTVLRERGWDRDAVERARLGSELTLW